MDENKCCYICKYVFQPTYGYNNVLLQDPLFCSVLDLYLCSPCFTRMLKWFADKVKEEFVKDK